MKAALSVLMARNYPAQNVLMAITCFLPVNYSAQMVHLKTNKIKRVISATLVASLVGGHTRQIVKVAMIMHS